MTSPQRAFSFKDFTVEAYFVRRLGELGHRVFEGPTDPDVRRERIRIAILKGKLDAAIMGRNPATKKPETFQQAYERHFGQPLGALA